MSDVFLGAIGVALGIAFGAPLGFFLIWLLSLNQKVWDWYIGNTKK
jgi:hypothetical protein